MVKKLRSRLFFNLSFNFYPIPQNFLNSFKMIFFFLFSFIYGAAKPNEKGNLINKVHVFFIVKYNDGGTDRFDINVYVPRTTKFKGFPKILADKTLHEHFEVPFIKENGEVLPGVQIIYNNHFLTDDEKESVIKPDSEVKFIYNLNKNTPNSKKEL